MMARSSEIKMDQKMERMKATTMVLAKEMKSG